MPSDSRKEIPGNAREPDRSGLTWADLPRPRQDRWSPQRKARVVAAIRCGLLSLSDAQKRYELSIEELVSWQGACKADVTPAFPGLTAGAPLQASQGADEMSRSSRDIPEPIDLSTRGGPHA